MADQKIVPLPDGAGQKIHNSLYQTSRETLSFTTGVTVLSFTLEAWANVTRIILEMPAFSAANPTGTVSIENQDGTVIYESSTCSEDDTHIIAPYPSVPIVGENTIKVTLSTNPLSSGIAYLTIYLEGN